MHLAVLNRGCGRRPGGGWRKGCGAQEESLFRRTDLCDHLANERAIHRRIPVKYPLPTFGGVMSTGVCVFRGTEEEGYPFLPEPFFVNVITAAAYHTPPTDAEGRLHGGHEKGMRDKIVMILRMACQYDIEHLVLSAFGCGAYGNPPRHMAELFRDILLRQEFKGQFKTITFAIIEDHNSSQEGNYESFREIFDTWREDLRDAEKRARTERSGDLERPHRDGAGEERLQDAPWRRGATRVGMEKKRSGGEARAAEEPRCTAAEWEAWENGHSDESWKQSRKTGR